MNEQERKIAERILKNCESSIKNVQWYLVLIRAVKLRVEIEKPTNTPKP